MAAGEIKKAAQKLKQNIDKGSKEMVLNSILSEKILTLSPEELQMEFFRPDEGMKVYHMGRGLILDLAIEAGELYKIALRYKIYRENK